MSSSFPSTGNVPAASVLKPSEPSVDLDASSSTCDMVGLETASEDKSSTEEMRRATYFHSPCGERPGLLLAAAVLGLTGFACFAAVYLTGDKNAPRSSSQSPSPNEIPSPVCVAASDLREAVDRYLVDSHPNADVSLQHGYPIGSWCITGAYDFAALFSASRNPLATTFNEDLSGWDMSSATNLDYMFEGAAEFNQDLSTWETSRVESIQGIFRDALSFNGDVSTWNTSRLENMKEAFEGATSFNRDLSLWKTSNVITMRDAFNNAASFNQPLNDWDVSKVENMRAMFAGASSFNQDLNNWDVSSVEFMSGMFQDAVSFNGNVNNWSVSSVTNMQGVFLNAVSFNQDVSMWQVRARVYSGMFLNAASFNQDLCSWGDFIQSNPPLNYAAEEVVAAQEIGFDSMFSGTACPDQADPLATESSIVGPFCHACSV